MKLFQKTTLAVFLLLAVLLASQTAFAGTKTVGSGGTNLRTEAWGDIAVTLDGGTTVEYLGEVDDYWCKVKYQGKEYVTGSGTLDGNTVSGASEGADNADASNINANQASEETGNVKNYVNASYTESAKDEKSPDSSISGIDDKLKNEQIGGTDKPNSASDGVPPAATSSSKGDFLHSMLTKAKNVFVDGYEAVRHKFTCQPSSCAQFVSLLLNEMGISVYKEAVCDLVDSLLNLDKPKFEKVPVNTSDNPPKKGDIIVWTDPDWEGTDQSQWKNRYEYNAHIGVADGEGGSIDNSSSLERVVKRDYLWGSSNSKITYALRMVTI